MQRTEVLKSEVVVRVCARCVDTHIWRKGLGEAGNVGSILLPEDGRGRGRGKERVRLLLWSS